LPYLRRSLDAPTTAITRPVMTRSVQSVRVFRHVLLVTALCLVTFFAGLGRSAIGDADGAWAYYLNTWRPGKPHPETWPALYVQALATTAPPQGA
jgi:hypothetical protein